MHAAQIESIDDIETLRRFAIEAIAERDALIATADRTIVFKDAKIDALTQEVARLRWLQHAAKFERFNPTQQALFDEAMAADLAAVEVQLDALRADADAERVTPAKPRAVPQRRPLPPELPRVEVRHEPASCTCGSCGGALHPIGEQVSEAAPAHPAHAAFVHPCTSSSTWSR